MAEQLIGYSDGSFFEGRGAWAFRLLDLAGNVFKDASGGFVNSESTNNRAELAGIIELLKFAAIARVPALLIRTDSQYCINVLAGGMERTANLDLLGVIDSMLTQIPTTFEHVKGHADDPHNIAVDKLAGEARLAEPENATWKFRRKSEQSPIDYSDYSTAIEFARANTGEINLHTGRLKPAWVGGLDCPNCGRPGGRPNFALAVSEFGYLLVACKGDTKNSNSGCSTDEIMQAFIDAKVDTGNPTKPLGKPVAVYEYKDEQGRTLFTVQRFKPKAVRYADAHGKRRNGVMETVRRVPFGLPELLSAPADCRVYILEGERDCLNARQHLNWVCTTNPGGARGKWEIAWNRFLRGHPIVIVADHDEKGLEHARDIESSLVLSGHDKSIKVVGQLPLGAKDITEYLQKKGLI